ncbi:uroporphyrinogen-III synthase [Rosettibacter firmus]|uniref:uroporphyrinogen-III synthase n=1 Tax=Rosettibacter firmus TaxID=3111522 RepID=UPI00336C134A
MNKKTIAILENRAQRQLANLILKNGWSPILAPVIVEVPDINLVELKNIVTQWENKPPDFFIFQTGAGVRYLFDALEKLGLLQKFFDYLKYANIIVRSIKPAAVLKTYGISPTDYTENPFTTNEVISLLSKYDLQGKHVFIQGYGEKNNLLIDLIKNKGADVIEVSVYKWDLPEDLEPIINFFHLLNENKIDIVVFTSAAQVINLIKIADKLNKLEDLRRNLNNTNIVSIGPYCSSVLKQFNINVTKEANPPKMNFIINAIKELEENYDKF